MPPLPRRRLLLEIIGFVALALLSKALLMHITWRYSGPISLVFTLIVLTLYMQRAGLNWEAFGLKRLPGLKAKLLILPQTLAVFVAFAVAAGSVLGAAHLFDLKFMLEVPDTVNDRWGAVQGNLPLYLFWLGIVWTAAAFGEEMFFRGYLVTRVQQVFSGYRFASILAVVLPALLFGFGHMYYQGLRGFVTTGAIAIAFGTMFLLFKRNLWPIILVHGIVDTLAFTALYLDADW